jgi:hypothetical protein
MLEQHFIKYKNPVLKLKGTVSQQSWWDKAMGC